MRIIEKCSCGADAKLISPTWYNRIFGVTGYYVRCITKKCKLPSHTDGELKQYKYSGVAIRYWNDSIKRGQRRAKKK